jgi:hypothetical protein
MTTPRGPARPTPRPLPDGNLTIARETAGTAAGFGCSPYRGRVGPDALGRQFLDAVAYTEDACRLGPVVAVYVDVDTGRPEFVGVQLDGAGSERLVPLVRTGMPEDRRLVVALAPNAVADSPGGIGADLSQDDTDELFRYYADRITGTSWDGFRPPDRLTGTGRVGLRRLTPAHGPDRSPRAEGAAAVANTADRV